MPDTGPAELRPSGPHSPEYTQRAADAVAGGIRVLNHATMNGADGLRCPPDAYHLLGTLYTAAGRLPQLLAQLAGFLERQAATGRLADDNGGDPADVAASAAFALGAAHGYAAQLAAALQDAQNSIAGLYAKEGTDA